MDYTKYYKLEGVRVGMRRQWVLFVLIMIFLIGGVFAVPSFPHSFRGSVRDVDGNFVLDGYVVTARLEGQGFSTSSVVKGGFYGYDDPLAVSDSSGNGGKVYFEVNGKLVENEPVDFVVGEVTELDLIVDSPPESFNCGDGYCNLSEGECSSCKIDCDVAKTNVCCGTGSCDSEVGESCYDCGADCGACVSSGLLGNSPIGGGSSGDGGSSGGGGSSSGGTLLAKNSSTVLLDDDEFEVLDDGNEESDLFSEEPEMIEGEGFFSVITGAAVGAFGVVGIVGVSVFVLAVIAGFVFVRFRKRVSD